MTSIRECGVCCKYETVANARRSRKSLSVGRIKRIDRAVDTTCFRCHCYRSSFETNFGSLVPGFKTRRGSQQGCVQKENGTTPFGNSGRPCSSGASGLVSDISLRWKMAGWWAKGRTVHYSGNDSDRDGIQNERPKSQWVRERVFLQSAVQFTVVDDP